MFSAVYTIHMHTLQVYVTMSIKYNGRYTKKSVTRKKKNKTKIENVPDTANTILGLFLLLLRLHTAVVPIYVDAYYLSVGTIRCMKRRNRHRTRPCKGSGVLMRAALLRARLASSVSCTTEQYTLHAHKVTITVSVSLHIYIYTLSYRVTDIYIYIYGRKTILCCSWLLLQECPASIYITPEETTHLVL